MNKLIIAVVILVFPFIQTNTYAKDYLFVSLEWPPLEYLDKEQRPTGLAVDIVTKIMSRLGHSVQIKIYPWARSLKLTRLGKADAIFTVLKTPERETFLDYSRGVLAPQTICLYKKKDGKISFNGDIDKLRQYRIGVVSTISYGQKFDQARSLLNIQRVATIEQNFAKIVYNRIDLTISNVYVGDYALKKSAFANQIEKIPTPVQKLPSFIAFSKKNNLKDLRDQFDKELDKMKQTGEFQSIMRHFDFEM